MPLPPRQIAVLRYLGKHKTATARAITRDLHMPRSAVRNALLELADVGFVSPDHSTWPTSWTLTDIGSAVVAAAHFERES